MHKSVRSKKITFVAFMNLREKIISNISIHSRVCALAVIFIFSITNTAYCRLTKGNDTTHAIAPRPDTIIHADSLHVVKNSLPRTQHPDAGKKSPLEDSLGIVMSKDALPAIVQAKAEDSAVVDMKHNIFYLYGKAQVNYQDLQLNAGRIAYQQTSNVITATSGLSAKDTGTNRPSFTQGKEKFTYDSIQYNFKSKRAIGRTLRSQYGEGYMYSEQIKRNPDQTIYGAHSIYTTCALDTPHFGIVANKIKAIPGRVVVSGPANLAIEGVPTPLFLPFGLFPISDKQKSGFVLPTYTVEQARGLGLLNGGYYFYLNDHVDLLTQANIYTKGSYAVSGVSDYSNIYQYRGLVNFSYAYNKTGQDYEPGATVERDFIFNWRHQTDPKSIPGQTFNASVQAGTSTFYSNNSYDANQILQNQYQSNISYSKTWLGTPFSLTVSALHNQNTQTKQINVTLPEVNFHITQLNPFQKKSRIGTRWYDKITLSYTMDGLNRTTFYDSTFSLNNLNFEKFHTGIHHTVPVSASYTIFRYVNMSFNFNYDEYWLNNKLYQNYDPLLQKIDSVNTYGFYTSRDFNTGVQFSTRIYGMLLFKKGRVKGIRHVLTPSVGFTYHPDFGASPFNYYYRTRLDSTSTYSYLSPYVTSVIGTPPIGKSGSVNFGINNNLQIKVRTKSDTGTGTKNITLIDAFGINSAYNMAVDSFQWSPISMNFRTNVLDKINISSTASFDPYAFDYQRGVRLKETMEDLGYGLARFTNATLSLGTNFHSKPSSGSKSPTNSEEYGRIMRNAGYNDYVDFNIPWSFNVSYSLNANKTYSTFSKRDTLVLTQSLVFQGELKFTERWKMTFSSGYDFVYHQLTLTSINVYRDLHCWAMHLQSIPFGPRKSYSFTLNVKAAALQDLKLVRRRDFRDTPY
jgi:LptD protein